MNIRDLERIMLARFWLARGNIIKATHLTKEERKKELDQNEKEMIMIMSSFDAIANISDEVLLRSYKSSQEALALHKSFVTLNPDTLSPSFSQRSPYA